MRQQKIATIRRIQDMIVGESGFTYQQAYKLNMKGEQFIDIAWMFSGYKTEQKCVPITRTGLGCGEYALNLESHTVMVDDEPQMESNGTIDVGVVPLGFRESHNQYLCCFEEIQGIDDYLMRLNESEHLLKVATARHEKFIPSKETVAIEYFFDKTLRIGTSEQRFQRTSRFRKDLKKILKKGQFNDIPKYLEFFEDTKAPGESLLPEQVDILEKRIEQTKDWYT